MVIVEFGLGSLPEEGEKLSKTTRTLSLVITTTTINKQQATTKDTLSLVMTV